MARDSCGYEASRRKEVFAMFQVKHNPERSRYELWVDGRLAGKADYDADESTVVFFHT